jgi:hypothetical protein
MSIDNASPNDWYVAYRNTEKKQPKTLGDLIKDRLIENSSASRQIGGDHYKGTSIQSWDVFLDWGLDPWACNVIKYVQRHRKKAGKQDLEKAKHYLEFMIDNYDKIGDKYYDWNSKDKLE